MTHPPVDTHIVDIPTTEEIEQTTHGSYGAVLKNPAFLFLWLGQIASQLGDRIVFVIFVALITAYYGANDSYNSWLYIAFTIPAICLTAIAGVFVDRWPRQRVLVATNLIRAGVVAILIRGVYVQRQATGLMIDVVALKYDVAVQTDSSYLKMII